MIARFMSFYKPGVTAAALRIPKGKGDAEMEPPWEALVPQQVTLPA